MATLKLTRSKKTLLVILLIILVIGVMIVVWVTSLRTVPDNATANHVPADNVQIAALNYIHNDDINGGLEYYDTQIESRQDKAERKRLLLDKSSFALQAGRSNDAVDAAKQADTISSDVGTMEALARAYESKGDKAQALNLYKKLLEVSSKDGNENPSRDAWEEKVKELQ